MNFKYTLNRRNATGVNQEQLEAVFSTIVKFYKEPWLKEKGTNPIQLLWNRNDELSTTELYSLGCAIQITAAIDHKWTVDQIKLSMSSDKKNRQGAIFEIYGLSLLQNTDHQIIPAKSNQPGFDGVLINSVGKELRISIKNYRQSESQRRFETYASLLEQNIIILLKKYKYPPVMVIVDSPTEYPEKTSWDLLNKHLDNIFKLKRDDKDGFTAITSGQFIHWTLIIYKLPDVEEKYHTAYQTYTLVVSSAYHKNEHLNLYDKLRDACANLTKHSKVESQGLINGLMLHIPASASINNCYQWVEDYFQEYKDKPISMVILYQPVVATEVVQDDTFLNHCIKIFVKEDKLSSWQEKGPPYLTLTFPVGRISEEPTLETLVVEYPNQSRETVTVNERYFYQRGEHYLKMVSDGKGGYEGNILNLGSGVFANLVIEFPDQPGNFAIKGRFAPTNDLLIL